MDGREWLTSYREQLQEIRARTVRAQQALATAAGTATSRDGAVTVTVDPAGALRRLVLSEGIDGLTRVQLADAVLDTAHRARQEAVRQAEDALVPVLGERSEAMAVLRAHLAVPGGER
jgi:DNA-binding protein YbaB